MPSVGALVQVADSKGRLLASRPDQPPQFVSPGSTEPASLGWILAAARRGGAPAGGGSGEAGAAPHCRYTLQHTATGLFLAAVSGEIRCVDAPDALQLFMDLDRRVVLRFAGRACLQSAPSGTAVAGRLPLGRDRASKLFSLREAGLPLRALQAWPLRAALRCEQAGGYLSAAGGGALSTTAQATCCREEFLLAPGEGGPLASRSGSLVAPTCALWTGDGRHLLSHEPLTGQLVLQPQHSCTGHERFTLQLSATGELQLGAQVDQPAELPRERGHQAGPSSDDPAAARGSSSAGENGSAQQAAGGEPAPVLLRNGGLATAGRSGIGSGKPAKLCLELASSKPALLLTAHGQLLSCQQPTEGSRPAGVLLPAAASGARTLGSSDGALSAPSHCGHSSAGPSSPGPSPAALERCAWQLSHHGDCVYSLRHASSGRGLYLDEDGVPCLEPTGGGAIIYPDERLLFWIEPGWVTLEAPPAGSCLSTPPGSPRAAGGTGSSSRGSLRSSPEGSSPSLVGNVSPPSSPGSSSSQPRAGSALVAAAGFVQPSSAAAGRGSGSLTAAGFTIRSVSRVGGKHLYLSALPGGLLTTVYAAGGPTRWELFTVADLQTLLDSPLGLLERLPCVSHAPAAQRQPLRRTLSMHTLRAGGMANPHGAGSPTAGAASGGSNAGFGRRSSGSGSSQPGLPAVQEVGPEAVPGQAAGGSSLGAGPDAGAGSDASPASPFQQHDRVGADASQPPPPTGQQPSAPEHAAAGRLSRRCQSETALAELQRRQQQEGREGGRRRRPLWLAQLLQSAPARHGWGTCSAASLQELACRQLCANLAVQYQQHHGGRRLPEGLVEAVELELCAHLPEELAARIGSELCLLLEPAPPTKLSLQALCGTAADQPKQVPAWALPFVPEDASLLQWHPSEAYVCTSCCGSSGLLLPLDPYVNPGHHLFLTAMERRARGGGRVRLRGRRRHGERGDTLLRALRAGKLLLLAWAAGRTLGAVVFGK